VAQGQVGPAGVGIVHVHSNYSHDGLDPLERVREFALERGISFVGMTDHAEDFDAARYTEFQEHCRGLSDARVTIIAGLEYRFAGFPGLHLLALGLSHMIDPVTPEQFCHLTRGSARFTIVAHPVLPNYQVPPVVADSIDAIEVWNAAYNTRWLPDVEAVRLYQRIARTRPDIVATAGLDQHDSRNDRETRVVLSNPSAADPLAELKAGRFINQGRTMGFDSRASLGSARLRALSAARWSLDRANRLHEVVMHLMPARGRRR
jgi:hypothetical protein